MERSEIRLWLRTNTARLESGDRSGTEEMSLHDRFNVCSEARLKTWSMRMI